ncbi:putative SOS response-associated peptidase YedK [Stackebrandtia albiflava]|uniref:Abasic site processing protein n=1 Tax=Stackebrandtia albiflava TaxID=406432 RepID=A0A562V5C3_9ACTN|nr:SOS response-associated peptidase [Stackebrandtia albiflava]TWJ13018.1 putative SOS response-associated peptidase YedK [Stackebrandtia albiflava]
MCGRYASTRSTADLATLFDAVDVTGGDTDIGFNMAPTQRIPVVRMSRSAEGRVVSAARWGLVPPWAKDPAVGVRMINARAETVTTSRAYRAPFARRRCLVPADGWYEWQKLPGGKQPYYTTGVDEAPLVFAGLWETWGGDSDRLMTCTILTVNAVGGLRDVHERMPLVLPVDSYRDWLEDPDAAEHLLRQPGEELLSRLRFHPVDRAVGNVRNDSPKLIEPVEVAGGATVPSQDTLF